MKILQTRKWAAPFRRTRAGAFAAAFLFLATAFAAGPALTAPTVAEAAAHFASPPNDYGIGLWWGWGGPMDAASIARDLDTIKKMGFTVACVEADNGITSKYLSPEWFALVKTAVAEAKKRNMYLWFEDEAKYPSGFAGGKFTAERPDLGMQVLAPAGSPIPVVAGQSISQDLPPDTVAAMAFNDGDNSTMPIDISSGKLNWSAPPGSWQIHLVRHEFRTSPTRSVNNPNSGAKDASESLEDYLNPVATQQFITWTHEQYKKAVGDEFGKTVLGFTGDEPDFTIGNALPWTNALFDQFQKEKGYDVRPFVGAFFSRQMTDRQRRAYVDYTDVWSEMFGDNFFGVQGAWCAANNCMYQLHVNHEDQLMALVRSEGDFFRCMAPVEMPGIDLIYAQIWPGKPTDTPPGNPADFPKLASSVAHVYGRARSYTESFAAMTVRPSVAQAKWILDEQFARGVNMVEVMWWTSPTTRLGRGGRGGGPGPAASVASTPASAMAPAASAGSTSTNTTASPSPAAPASANSSSANTAATPVTPASAGRRGARGGAGGPSFFASPDFPPVAQYLHRASYLLSIGKPTAKIGLYVPFSSMWFGDGDAYKSCLALSAQLLQNQRDFDFLDEHALAAGLSLNGGQFTNLSGENYQAIIIPSVTTLSQAALDRLRQFATAGGKVFFVGRLPTLAPAKNYLDAPAPADLSWAVHEASGQLTPAIFAALPVPQVSLDQPHPDLKYAHRRLQDADIYFFFNENLEETQTAQATLAGTGLAQMWDARTGTIAPIPGVVAQNGQVTLPLTVGPSQTQFIVIGLAPTK
jgi:hypothetical protein